MEDKIIEFIEKIADDFGIRFTETNINSAITTLTDMRDVVSQISTPELLKVADKYRNAKEGAVLLTSAGKPALLICDYNIKYLSRYNVVAAAIVNQYDDYSIDDEKCIGTLDEMIELYNEKYINGDHQISVIVDNYTGTADEFNTDHKELAPPFITSTWWASHSFEDGRLLKTDYPEKYTVDNKYNVLIKQNHHE
jgi:hypothetical protein